MHSLILLLSVSVPVLADSKPTRDVVLTGATVIDATGSPAKPNQIVVLRGERILAAGDVGKVEIPKEATVVDAAGKFLIPGLWDMHVHTVTADYLKLYLANGVTGVRDMHSFVPELTVFPWRKQTAEGKLLGPRLVLAGAIVDGSKPFWPGSVAAADPEAGRAAVRSLKKRGADFVKIYSQLSRETFLAIADEAKQQGMTFAGHVPEAVGAHEASSAGQRTMEHLYGISLACSRREEELRREIGESLKKGDVAAFFGAVTRSHTKAMESLDEAKAAALFAHFAKQGTYQCPTLTVLRSFASLEDPRFTADPRVKYLPGYLKNNWKKGPTTDVVTSQGAAVKRAYADALKLVGRMRRAGVEILAGTDTTNPFCFPGFSLHDELELLVQAGLTPLEALQSATVNPAKCLDRAKDLGTVERGKLADLVLLDANPLDDIRNTRKIAAVVVNGRLLNRDALDKMLAEVEAAAK